MGYLNTQPTDDYNLQAMAQGGQTTTELPAASGLDGLLTVVPKAVASAGVAVGSLAKDALADTPVGDYAHGIEAGVDQFNSAGKFLLGYETMPDIDPQARASAQAATAVMSKWAETGEDPRVTGTLGRTLFGPVKGLSIIAGATPVVGPWGAAALYGTSEGREGYQQDVAAGIDPTTAMEKAAVTGVTSGAGALIPGMGGSLATKIAAGIGANVALDVGGRMAASAVLHTNGYTAQAAQQKIFDGQSLLADTILGAAFGVHSHLTEGVHPSEINPADVDTSAAVLAQSHFERSAPGIPTDPAAANLHVDTMSKALDALAHGDEMPDLSAHDAQTLMTDVLPDPIHQLAPHIIEAAHAEIPQFSDAVAPVREMEPVRPAAGEPIGPLPPDAEGKPAPAQFDDMTQQRIDHLTSQYGDLQVTREDGSTGSVNEIAREMQGQMADADSMSKAHEAAAACFLRSGSAA